jgi:hypothetical protein
MAPSDAPTLFTAPPGFFDGALLFTHRDHATAPLPPSNLGLGLQGLQLHDKLESLPVADEAPTRVGAEELLLQSWNCHGCRAVFQSLEEQRAHFKSDFHKFNVRHHSVSPFLPFPNCTAEQSLGLSICEMTVC